MIYWKEIKNKGTKFISIPIFIGILVFQYVFAPLVSANTDSDEGAGISVSIICESPLLSPEQITDLFTEPWFVTGIGDDGSGKIRLTWTAPKDLPNNDKVFSYIVKYASFSIADLSGYTTDWWTHPEVKTLTSIEQPPKWGIPAQKLPGQTEIYSITQLIPAEYYWFAVKAVDKFYQHSEIDVLAEGITAQAKSYASTSIVPPGKISALIAEEALGEIYSVKLTWIPPGNNEYQGKIVDGKYRICYSTEPPPSFAGDDKYNPLAKWQTAKSVYISTSNVYPGDSQTITINDLTLHTTYFFIIWTADEWYLTNKSTYNWSYESCLSSSMPYFDLPPDSVTRLNVIASGSVEPSTGSYTKLTWTNPSDFDFKGTRICFSISSYPSTENDGIITDIDLSSGTTTDYYFYQLVPRTTYYYSLFAYDRNNLFASRTTGYAYTEIDLISPEPVTNLIALTDANSTDGCYIDLSWNNPSTGLYQNKDWVFTRIYVSTITESAWTSPKDIFEVPITTSYYRDVLLEPQVTYYYAIQTIDGDDDSTVYTKTSAYTWKDLISPEPVTDLTITLADYSEDIDIGAYLKLSWTNPSDRDLKELKVYYTNTRYPEILGEGIMALDISNPVANQANEQTVTELLGNTTYYFTFFYEDLSGNISSNTISGIIIIPRDQFGPFMPLGLGGGIGDNKINLRWSKVKYNSNLTAFSAPPKSSELYRYQIYKSNDLYASWLLTASVKPYFNTDSISLDSNYYKIRAVDICGNYSDSMIIDKDLNIYMLSSTGDYLMMKQDIADILIGEKNSYKKDLYVKFTRNESQERGPILKSININFCKLTGNKLEKINNFAFPKHGAEIAFKYNIASNGYIKASRLTNVKETEVERWLSIFYFNNIQWLKQGTQVDKTIKVAKTKFKFSGSYQLRKSLSATEFTFCKVMPKIITPNNDGRNDRVLFEYANPKNSSIKIKIYDLTGALVKNLIESTETSDNTGLYIYWDGTDENNQTVPPGVYIYQLEGEGEVVNGTIVVAR